MLNWETTKEDMDLIREIVKRVNESFPGNVKDIGMDITATHLNGCPLNLKGLVESSGIDFIHDVYGIANNINRETGKLENCFSPRFSK